MSPRISQSSELNSGVIMTLAPTRVGGRCADVRALDPQVISLGAGSKQSIKERVNSGRGHWFYSGPKNTAQRPNVSPQVSTLNVVMLFNHIKII